MLEYRYLHMIVAANRVQHLMACGLLFVSSKGHSNHPIVQSIEREGSHTMDYAVTLIISNTLMAVFIYVIVTKIWQD